MYILYQPLDLLTLKQQERKTLIRSGAWQNEYQWRYPLLITIKERQEHEFRQKSRTYSCIYFLGIIDMVIKVWNTKHQINKSFS